MKVVLVSSGQPSINPRLVKEADVLADAGYEVFVLYAYWTQWATDFDERLLEQKKWTAVRVGGDPVSAKRLYNQSRLLYKIARTLFKISHSVFADFAIARASYYLINEVKRYRADLYIGHNLGALGAVVQAAKKNGKPSIFDAEDFHRHEISNDRGDLDVALKVLIEKKYLPQVTALTTSSPGIARAYQELFPQLSPSVILNVFPKSKGIQNMNIENDIPIKLFWFSQTIGSNRGIDDVIGALAQLDKSQFELHLLGDQTSHSSAFIQHLKNIRDITLIFHQPVAPDKLIEFATNFDIGLALEPGFSINNDLALSNKIFTYMQSGLAIIASDTTAQKEFMSTVSQIGSIYKKGDIRELARVLLEFYNDRSKLAACKKAALAYAHDRYNWETESCSFLELVKSTLITNS